jgi:hypothetical protein
VTQPASVNRAKPANSRTPAIRSIHL